MKRSFLVFAVVSVCSACVELQVPDAGTDAGPGGGGGSTSGGGGGSTGGGGGGAQLDAGVDAGTDAGVQVDAGPACATLDTTAHCGSCNHACAGAELCIAGSCVRPACSWVVRGGAATPVYLNSGTPGVVAAGDFDEDGRQDLAVGASTGPLSIFFQTDAGLVERSGPSGSAYGAFELRALDLDGDRHLDLAADVSYWLGNGTGTFRRPSQPATFATPLWRSALFDIDRDGFPDAIAQVQDRLQLQPGSATANAPVVSLGQTGLSQPALALGDVTGDGFGDLLLSTNASGSWTTSLAAGSVTRTFGAPTSATTAYGSSFAHELLVCDVVAGGRAEFIEFAADGQGRVFSADTGAPVSRQTLALGNNVKRAVCVDLDADGDLDLVTSHYATNGQSVRLSLNSGGTLGAPTTLLSNVAMGTLAVADLDGDGVLDVAAAGQNNVQVLFGQCQ